MDIVHVLVGITIILSFLAFRFWLNLFHRRLKPLSPEPGLADMNVTEWPGLISLLLPRRVRAMWNAVIFGLCVFLLGFPHHLVIWNFWNHTRLGPWLYFHYAWTLCYWLLLLALPAMLMARHQRSRRQLRQRTEEEAAG